MWSVEEGEGGTIWDNSIETYTLPYVKQTASGSLMCDPGNPEPVLCNNLEGRVGREVEAGLKREGTYIYLMPIHIEVWQKQSHNGWVIIL